VAEAELIHPDGERILITRISADQTDFDLAALPGGREVKSSWAVNSLASVMSMLDLQSVSADDGTDWEDAVRLRILLFSGMEIMAEVRAVEDQYQLRLHAAQIGANHAQDVAEQSPETAVDPVEAQAASEVSAAVEEINRKTAGWVYGIAKYKYEAMVKRTEDLLKPAADS
jgi:hypothetical protein